MADTEFDRPEFLALLRGGDAAAYRRLIRRFHGSLVGTASAVIGSRAQAEEVVQDAWLAVFAGIGRFEGRSSLSSWLFAIVLNRARTRASRESRTVALPALDAGDSAERAVPLERFTPDGHWSEAPRLWDELDPERVVGGRQLWQHVQDAIETLPSGQKAVIILRDIEARSAEEACSLLEISPENQRVLLHRARGRVRRSIEVLIDGPAARPAEAKAKQRARPGLRPGPAGDSSPDPISLGMGVWGLRPQRGPGAAPLAFMFRRLQHWGSACRVRPSSTAIPAPTTPSRSGWPWLRRSSTCAWSAWSAAMSVWPRRWPTRAPSSA